jgi:hypothetical protein
MKAISCTARRARRVADTLPVLFFITKSFQFEARKDGRAGAP